MAVVLMLMPGILLAQQNNINFYIQKAIGSSPLLNDFHNQIVSAGYDSLLVRAAYKPQISGSSYNLYFPVLKGVGYDQAITNGANFSVLIGINKEFANKKSINTRIQSLDIQIRSANNSSFVEEQTLKQEVGARYITVYTDLEELKYNRAISELLKRQEIILRKLTASNVYKQVDYLNFIVTQQQHQMMIMQLTIKLRSDFSALNYLCGLSDTAIFTLEAPEFTIKPLPALSKSVFIEKFVLDSLKLSNNKALININYRPKFNVFADAGYNSTLAYSAYKNFGTSFGVSAVVPIYDGKQRNLKYDKIKIEERTRQGYQSFFTSQYLLQTNQLNQQLIETESLIAELNAHLKYPESLIDVNEKLLNAGEVRITDYLLAISTYLNAKNLITQQNSNRLQLINQLSYWNR